MGLLKNIKQSLSLDYRSLAFYRFFIGIIILADVSYRWPDLNEFYTDVGLVPRALFTGEMSMPWSFSFHLANGSLPFAYFLFGFQFLLGVMLIVGYKTRLAMVFSYLLNVSVHNRDWLINNGGDDILRAILFLSIFLPLNKCFSMDSALEEKKSDTGKESSHFSSWGLTFFLQVFVIYFVSYLLKNHPIWRKDFTGVFFASRLDVFATPLGFWLRDFSTFQKLATVFTVYLEWLGPLLLVFSVILGRFWWIGRSTVVLLFWFLHVGIILTMYIGVFPFTCLVMWSIFIPGQVWDKVFEFLKTKFSPVTLYFDEECNFCRKSVLIAREFFLFPESRIMPAQSNAEINNLMKKNNSVVLVNAKGEKFLKYGAFLELAKNSPLLKLFLKLFSLAPAKFVGNKVYEWVSSHRMEMGKISQFFPTTMPKKEIISLKLLYQFLGVIVFMSVLMWNASTVKTWGIKNPYFQHVTRYIHLYQEWNMFAPFPKLDNVWLEVNGKLNDGSEIELLTGDRDVFSIKSDKFYKTVKNEHWRKLYLNISERSDYARYFGGYLCRKWNERKEPLVPGTTLRKLEIASFSQQNLPNGERGGVTRKLTWNHWCFDEDYQRENGGKK